MTAEWSPVEGHLAGHHVVERRARDIDVGPEVDVQLAADLLRADVVRRAVGPAGLAVRPPRFGRPCAGQTHIGQLHHALLGDHDVLGLDVAVDQAVAMGVLEGLGDLDDDVQGLLASL